MTLTQIIGICFLAAPFVMIFAMIVRNSGWRELFVCLGLTFAVVAPLMLGSYLLWGPS